MQNILNIKRLFFYISFFAMFLPLWQINLGIKVDPFQIFGAVFMILFIYSILYEKQSLYINKATKYLIYILSIVLLVKVFSAIPAVLYGIKHDAYIIQFLKGIIYEIFNYILLLTMIIYILGDKKRNESELINYYLIFVLISCLYQFSQLFLMIFFQIDLDEIIWPAISFNYNYQNALLDPIGGSSYIDFFRAGSFFGNPNAFAGFLILGFTTSMIFFIFSKEKRYLYLGILILLSILCTLSRAGFAGAIMSLLLIFIFYLNILIKSYKKHLVTILISFIIPLVYFFEYTKVLFARLVNLNFSNMFDGRLDIWLSGISVIDKNPFGYGHNNTPQTIEHYAAKNYGGGDVHNYFLETLINYGILGFIITISLWIYLLSFLRRQNPLSSSVTFSIIALLMMGMATNSISQIYVLFPILLFYVLSLPKIEVENLN